ncbi:MAG: LCP family protein [Eubacteriales bacterium]|nr:LCP family protein [Eubacteriales bacterium]
MANKGFASRILCALVALVLALGALLPGALAQEAAPANPMMPTAAPLPTEAPEQTSAPVQEEEVFMANPVGEEALEMTDEMTQDWYDDLFAQVVSDEIEPGVVVGRALRVKGQESLSETEAEVMLTLENVQLNENDMISSEGKVNIMLLGVDARPGQSLGRSDAMILCSIDVETNTIKLISFMRDMYVQIPDHNPNRLNTAYYWGGEELLFRTLKANFGVTADHFVAVDFSVLGSLIDQLGGLEIEIEDQYFVDRVNAVIENDNKVLGIATNDGFVKEPGLQTLTGKQAQAYARFRYGSKSGGDYARTGRQREVLMKIFDKVTQLSVGEMVELAMANIGSVDTNMTLVDIAKLAPLALQLKDATFEELRVPADGYYEAKTIKGMAVLLPDYDRINAQIRAFLE